MYDNIERHMLLTEIKLSVSALIMIKSLALKSKMAAIMIYIAATEQNGNVGIRFVM